jgi:fructose-1,6-bisphosphatase/inositol monophosphatase family enzyme
MEDPRPSLSAALVAELHEQALVFADAARKIIEDAWERGFTVERKRDGSLVTSADLDVERTLRQLIAAHYPEHGVLGEEFPPTRTEADFQWILDPIDGTEDFAHRVPTFGSILALHYRDAPVVGVLDHPALGLRCHAAFRRGAYQNYFARHGGTARWHSDRVALTDLAPGVAPAQVRLVTSARGNYIRYRDEGSYFDAVTRAYPNHRIYRSCYGHTLVATGGADAMVDFHDATWDLAACRITTEEAGGAYRVVREFTVDGVSIQSVVLGKPAVVAHLCELLDAA